MDEYDIYIRGFAADRDETPEERLARVFGLDARRAFEFVQSLPRVAKRYVPAKYATRYALALRELGADFELRKSAIRPQQIIAVQGNAEREDALAQQHGGTLTLPPPNFAPSIPPSASGGESPFAQTVVDRDEPRAYDAALFASNASPYDTLRESMPAQSSIKSKSGTIPEHSPLAIAALSAGAPALQRAPAPPQPWEQATAPPQPSARVIDPLPAPPAAPPAYTWPEQRAPSPWPPQSPPAADVPARPAAAGMPSPAGPPAMTSPAPDNPWAPIEPNMPPVSGANAWSALQAPMPPPSDPPPPAYSPAALDLDGRPEWLVAGSNVYQQSSEALHGRAGSAPEVGMQVYGESDPQLDTPLDDAAQNAPVTHVPRGPTAISARADRASAARAIGVPIGRESAASELPMPLRIGLRIGMGVSLFVIVSTLRHCRAFDSDVEQALAQWGTQPAGAEPAEQGSSSSASAGASHYGPAAGEWLESDLHQCTSGDKDRARDLVNRYKEAGAVEVYIGGIMRSGPVQYAGELIVELPRDADRRKAVLAEHQRVLEARFGGFAAAVADPGGPVLRVAL